MRLITAQVTNFRCVEDSNEFSLDNLTCLVGKNESGKTALLQALYRVNPHDMHDAALRVDEDYPRRYLLDYDARHADAEAVVVRTVWRLERDDIAAVEERLGPNALLSDQIAITRDYAGSQLWAVKVDRLAAFRHVLEHSELDELELEEVAALASVKRLVGFLEEQEEGLSERQQLLLDTLHAQFEDGSAVAAAIDILSHRAPTFLYFSSYHCMPGQVQLEALAQRREQRQQTPEDKVFLAFLALAGISLDTLLRINQFEPLLSRLESASSRISKELFQYWTQNPRLQVKFRLDVGQPGDPAPYDSGRILRTRIYNPDHEISVSFGDRSSGFVWFFSFLVLFSQFRRSNGERVVLLLDEPGLSLHAKGQRDLLRFIRQRLLPHQQVIYSTHSPFMVPADNLRCTRTVEDVIERDESGVRVHGTKVHGDALSSDADTLFPLQGALGYEIVRSLAIREHTLLVQSAAELVYFRALALELAYRDRQGLDPRWRICPLGSVERVPAFLALLDRNSRDVAVFSDFPGEMDVVSVCGARALKQNRIFAASMYTGQAESSVEDMLGKELFFLLVNKAFGLTKKKKLKVADCQRPAGIAGYARDALRSSDPDTLFDRLAPATILLERRPKLLKGLKGCGEALDRFEALFADLNALL